MSSSRSEARQRLVTVARRRFAADGAFAPTLDELRREAEVSVGALYHHFPDKRALMAAVYAQLMAEYQQGFVGALAKQATAEGGIRAGVTYHLRWIAEHRQEASLLLGDRFDSDALAEANRVFFRAVDTWWKPHHAYGMLRPMQTGVTAALWIGPAQEYCRFWITTEQSRIAPGVVKTLAEAAWAALRQEDS